MNESPHPKMVNNSKETNLGFFILFIRLYILLTFNRAAFRRLRASSMNLSIYIINHKRITQTQL